MISRKQYSCTEKLVHTQHLGQRLGKSPMTAMDATPMASKSIIVGTLPADVPCVLLTTQSPDQNTNRNNQNFFTLRLPAQTWKLWDVDFSVRQGCCAPMNLLTRFDTKHNGARASGIQAMTALVMPGLRPTFSLKNRGKNLQQCVHHTFTASADTAASAGRHHVVVWSKLLTEPFRMDDETDDMDCGGVTVNWSINTAELRAQSGRRGVGPYLTVIPAAKPKTASEVRSTAGTRKLMLLQPLSVCLCVSSTSPSVPRILEQVE